jgi:hypothetical protein
MMPRIGSAIDRFRRTRIGGWTALHVMYGKPRDIPLPATPFDDGWALIASATGVEKNPGWYLNQRHGRAAAWSSLAVARSHALRTKRKVQSANGTPQSSPQR